MKQSNFQKFCQNHWTLLYMYCPVLLASETRGTTALVYLQLHSSLYTGTVHVLSRARILKHLLEAEKSTFQEELSFQRSKNTTGLKQEHVFCAV